MSYIGQSPSSHDRSGSSRGVNGADLDGSHHGGEDHVHLGQDNGNVVGQSVGVVVGMVVDVFRVVTDAALAQTVRAHHRHRVANCTANGAMGSSQDATDG